MVERAKRKTRVGRVTSDKADKTISVAIERLVRHRLYKKATLRTNKLMADDPKNEARIGDLVQIMETRPMSKNKRWRLISVIEKVEEL